MIKTEYIKKSNHFPFPPSLSSFISCEDMTISAHSFCIYSLDAAI
nr:hypothetical protein [Tanacetum cinerariifolium]